MSLIAHIETRAEYDYCISRGYNPLLNDVFSMDIHLRVEIQNEIFGHRILHKDNVQKANQRFYEYCWKHYPHFCEETGRPLHHYSSEFISHILTRGAHPEMAHDPRNVNILFTTAHNKWEFGKTYERQKMFIFPKNMQRILQLREEYSKLRL